MTSSDSVYRVSVENWAVSNHAEPREPKPSLPPLFSNRHHEPVFPILSSWLVAHRPIAPCPVPLSADPPNLPPSISYLFLCENCLPEIPSVLQVRAAAKITVVAVRGKMHAAAGRNIKCKSLPGTAPTALARHASHEKPATGQYCYCWPRRSAPPPVTGQEGPHAAKQPCPLLFGCNRRRPFVPRVFGGC